MTAHLAQVAFSVTDLKHTHQFYQEVLGFEPAGGTAGFRGPLTSAATGLPDAAALCWWMVDRREFMQLEFFEFESPPVRKLPHDWRCNDIGYVAIGVWVADIDTTRERVEQAGCAQISSFCGTPGARRFSFRDPEGVLVEVMEDRLVEIESARPALSLATQSVRLSVPDLEKAARFWVDTLALEPCSEVHLHTPGREGLWGMEDASIETLVLDADGCLIELVQYKQPVGRPWPEGYRISDQGLLNVALGYRDMDQFLEALERVLSAGYTANSEYLPIGPGGCVYCNDDQGFSVELLCSTGAAMDEAAGFVPRPTGTMTRGRDLGGAQASSSK